MRSMTGYGRGEGTQDGFKVTVELASVNRRQSEVSIALPRELESLEVRLRDVINERVARGRLNVKVALQAAGGTGPSGVCMNLRLAKAYARELKRLSRELGVPGPVTLEVLVRAPGVFQVQDELGDAEAVWPALQKATRRALDALVRMREREGAHLEKDLRRRIETMRKAVGRVRQQAPRIQERYREQLRERIREAGLDAPSSDDERLLREVVYFADRSDITEELTRLQSHFQQFEDCLQSKEPVGRTLDFLAQEINRELNTLGSKAGDSFISREVVALKAELERFREQVQNVE